MPSAVNLRVSVLRPDTVTMMLSASSTYSTARTVSAEARPPSASAYVTCLTVHARLGSPRRSR